jgi:hypothetical protein
MQDSENSVWGFTMQDALGHTVEMGVAQSGMVHLSVVCGHELTGVSADFTSDMTLLAALSLLEAHLQSRRVATPELDIELLRRKIAHAYDLPESLVRAWGIPSWRVALADQEKPSC